jgi:LEA14-like dessication related protein
MFRIRRVLVLALAFLAQACAMVGDLEPPMVSLADLRIERMGLFEQDARVTLSLRNPNDQALPIDGAKFNIKLNGESFARGVSNESVSVPRLGEATIEALVSVSTFDVLNQFLNLGNALGASQVLTYEMDGTAFYSGLGFMRRSAPFTQTGKLKLGGSGGAASGGIANPLGGFKTLVPM